MRGTGSEEIASTTSLTRRADGNSSEPEFCKYHLERKSQKVRATHCVGGDWMCENCYRGAPMGYAARTGNEKLTEKERKEIHRKLKNGALATDLALEYGVSRHAIHRIKHNILYRFL